MNVFTYGTLMFPEVWQAVVGRRFSTIEGTLSGFAIYRVRDELFPGIIASDDRDLVPGVVYLDVDGSSIERLDAFEGDFYQRQAVWVDRSDSRRLLADAYVVPLQNRHALTGETWERAAFIASGGVRQFTRDYPGFIHCCAGNEPRCQHLPAESWLPLSALRPIGSAAVNNAIDDTSS